MFAASVGTRPSGSSPTCLPHLHLLPLVHHLHHLYIYIERQEGEPKARRYRCALWLLLLCCSEQGSVLSVLLMWAQCDILTTKLIKEDRGSRSRGKARHSGGRGRREELSLLIEEVREAWIRNRMERRPGSRSRRRRDKLKE